MAEKKSGYEIGQEFSALMSLIDELTESEREITEEDEKFLNEETMRIGGDIKDKINNCCKLVKNCEIEASIAEAEKDAIKGQVERLTKRANARLNVAKKVKYCVIGYLMSLLKQKKINTELFTVYYQNNQKSVQEVTGFFNPDLIHNEFLKREINPTAVKRAIEEGRLFVKTDEEVEKNPLLKGKIFYPDGTVMEGVLYTGGQCLVIR